MRIKPAVSGSALQSLPVVSRLMPEILAGTKRHTIRWHEKTIIPGPMRYINVSAPEETALVWVTDVKTCRLDQVARLLNKTDEWTDSTLLEGMREHYPFIELHSQVQVIYHLSPAQSAQYIAEKQRN